MKAFTIKVTWFKPSGKYYAHGYFTTSKESMIDVFDDFKSMLKKGKRPGLCDNKNTYFTAVLTTEDHPAGFPALFHPEASHD